MAAIVSIMRKIIEKEVVKSIIYSNMHGTGHTQLSRNLNGIFYEH